MARWMATIILLGAVLFLLVQTSEATHDRSSFVQRHISIHSRHHSRPNSERHMKTDPEAHTTNQHGQSRKPHHDHHNEKKIETETQLDNPLDTPVETTTTTESGLELFGEKPVTVHDLFRHVNELKDLYQSGSLDQDQGSNTPRISKSLKRDFIGFLGFVAKFADGFLPGLKDTLPKPDTVPSPDESSSTEDLKNKYARESFTSTDETKKHAKHRTSKFWNYKKQKWSKPNQQRKMYRGVDSSSYRHDDRHKLESNQPSGRNIMTTGQSSHTHHHRKKSGHAVSRHNDGHTTLNVEQQNTIESELDNEQNAVNNVKGFEQTTMTSEQNNGQIPRKSGYDETKWDRSRVHYPWEEAKFRANDRMKRDAQNTNSYTHYPLNLTNTSPPHEQLEGKAGSSHLSKEAVTLLVLLGFFAICVPIMAISIYAGTKRRSHNEILEFMTNPYALNTINGTNQRGSDPPAPVLIPLHPY